MPWVEGMDDSLVVVVGGLVAVIVVMLTVMWLVRGSAGICLVFETAH
jgi:hypothetical protein